MTKEEQAAYDAGRDCAKVGPNMTNCNFRHFATREQTKAWERGKADQEIYLTPARKGGKRG